ncbi:TetR/AcrR family transcriptional regulator [Subtercola boreus]|uniref:TetR family transcriptional regulator n=1 Tax=Subtercola boreus TaxID=120213 RepID=A0A3E0W729_9MICO|nr:TetR/AcrR family transcriptional regulator [Subtercola boreus]RFA18272.1 TetR family transcriptional regulator [Subtercola boreus]RFA18664.1 TetR family transcriptional regulator [Subtercola boreus]RFA25267.1 TetR family transcriptional regulator [Subtercola boreus]
MSIETGTRSDTRSRIVEVAAQLLREQGPAGVTTRRVAEAAGVQAPTIYRLFGDKDGLLDAVAEFVLATFVSTKAAIVEAASADDVDPLDDLRAGWRAQIEFGVANPELFRLLSDPARGRSSPAAESGKRVLEARIHRVAVAGRLRVAESRAVDLVQAAGIGCIQTLLATAPGLRDAGLADSMYEAVLAQILAEVVPGEEHLGSAPLAALVGARAISPELDALSEVERMMLAEWLDRAIHSLQRTRL